MLSFKWLLLSNLGTGVGGLNSGSNLVSTATVDHLLRTRDIRTKNEHATTSWVTGNLNSGTYGLGGSAVFVRGSSSGEIRFDHVDDHLVQSMPSVSLAEASRAHVQLTSGGQPQTVLVQHKNTSVAQKASFAHWAQEATWEDDSALITGLLPFLEQEHPARLRPCVETAANLELNCSQGSIFKGERASGPAFLVDVSIFGFDLDVLEIKLHELASVVDLFCIIEMPVTHRGQPKPLLWARNKNKKRFADFRDKVLHVVVDDVELLRELNTTAPGRRNWKFEKRQESFGFVKMGSMVRALLARAKDAGREVLVNFGDVDEIASPKNLALAKHCQPKKLPIDHATWMPMGRFDRALSTDYPVSHRLPFTFGNPTLQDLDHFAGRRFGKSGRYLLGGWHLTNYAYVPSFVAKSLTCTECRGVRPDLLAELKKGQMSSVFEVLTALRFFAVKLRPVSEVSQTWPYSNDTSLLQPPCIVANNKERYEVWFGKNDRRLQMVPSADSNPPAPSLESMRSSRLHRYEVQDLMRRA
mmetsp:Transcript_150449/g.273794  ORF Transcript_150449/g.273794 Transcript_150449/m.273794 type:complete len:527 (-) Transcript_150449:1-1581(-)